MVARFNYNFKTYLNYPNYLLLFLNFYKIQKLFKYVFDINQHIKFMLQVLRQWEDLAMMPSNTINKKITIYIYIYMVIFLLIVLEKTIWDLKNYNNEEKLNFKTLPFQNQWITYMTTQSQILSFYFHVVNLEYSRQGKKLSLSLYIKPRNHTFPKVHTCARLMPKHLYGQSMVKWPHLHCKFGKTHEHTQPPNNMPSNPPSTYIQTKVYQRFVTQWIHGHNSN